MNDRIDFERLVNERFAREHDVRPPDRAVDEILTQAGRVRPLPRWLALIKEPSMRYSSRLGVGSPTARILAILAATLLLVALVTAAGAGAARLLAADGQLIVDASGGGTHRTITDAVADSRDGDVILIRPGNYAEAVLIDKDITLKGDGPREDIVINAPEGGPTIDFAATGGIQQFEWPYTFLLDDTQADVRGLTFAGVETSVVVDGGSPILSDLAFEDNEFGLLIGSGSTATITDNLMTGGGGIEAAGFSEPLIERNVLRDGPSIYGSLGDGAVVRDNSLAGGGGISLGGMVGTDHTTALIEGNTITGASGYAIEAPSHGTSAPVILNNTISGSRNGIHIFADAGLDAVTGGDPDAAAAQPLVRGNDISAEMIAMSVNWSDARVVDNTIRGAWNGIVLFGGGSPELMGNEVAVDGYGIDIGANTSPSVDGNSVCGGNGSIKIHDDSTPSMGENATCDDA